MPSPSTDTFSLTARPRIPLRTISNMNFGFLGIQIGWGLQIANMSAIYTYLGADADQLPILWLAAPLTGLLIQPLIGQASDRTWTRLGRRRPFILGGAILAFLAMICMPNSPSIWVAAALLWVLDGTINASMQPFRALVAESLPEEQGPQGFVVQSLFIGIGGTFASALPYMMTHWFGVAPEAAGMGHIPASVRFSFYLGAFSLVAAVLWSVFTTTETPPSDSELVEIRARKFDWTLGLWDILRLIPNLPRRMWELGLVQFFTWIPMFLLWNFFSATVAKDIFHALPGSREMEAAGSWSGVCFGEYNAVCFVFSFVLLWASKFTGPKVMHALCLLVGAAGFASVHLASGPNQLLISMTCIGVAWASILSMPYAILAPSLPKDKVGVLMGMFNLFIVIPQAVAAWKFGFVLDHFLHGEPMNALMFGGVTMAIAAVLTLVVVSHKNADGRAAVPVAGGAH